MYAKVRTTTFFLILLSSLLRGQDTLVITDADLVDANYLWSKDNIYILDGRVVLEGGKLEIEPGTLIIAKRIPSDGTSSSSSLVIDEGAQIIARGTQGDPITFTGENMVDPFFEGGNWSGIQIRGNEGLNSGELKYVSIRNAGVSDSLETGSALILSNVDKNTSIDHVEVFISGGDGFRILGGTVNISYAVVSYVIDDAFDYNFGWAGNGIYWYANGVGTDRSAVLPDGLGSFAIEGKSHITDHDTLISKPTIFNSTLIGENCGFLGSATMGALGLFENSQGLIANSVLMHYPNHGIYIEDKTGSDDSYAALNDGQLKILSNIWNDFGRAAGSLAGNKFSSAPGGLVLTDSAAEDPDASTLINHLVDNYNLISGFGTIKNLAGVCIAIDPRLDPENDYGRSPNVDFPQSDFFQKFETPQYKGAFSSDLWIRDWTALDKLDSIIRLGEEGLGTYLFGGKALNQNDTIIISCEDLPDLQDSLMYIFPCRPILYQIGAAHRKGNPRRSRPKGRSEELEYAFIEQWDYLGYDAVGCSVAQELHLTVLVFDTIAPIIHPIPDLKGGLTAIPEDCDEAWIISTQIDTLVRDDSGNHMVKYTFLAEDYSGNQSSLVVELRVDQTASEWFADIDQDGFGDPEISLIASDSIPGFVSNNGDCNDSDPYAYPGSMGPGGLYLSDYDCNLMPEHHDLCSQAMEIPVGATCLLSFGDLFFANPTLYPHLKQSCLPRDFDDVWVKTILPSSGGVHIRINENILGLLDLTGFNRIFMAEIYSGNCHELIFEQCYISENNDLIIDFENTNLADQTLYIRIMEIGNTNESPFEICIIDLADKVANDLCSKAQTVTIQAEDTCTWMDFSNLNAVPAEGNVFSECHEDFAPADIWFKYITTNVDSFQLLIDTISGSAFTRPVVILYSGDCDHLAEVACFSYENEGPSFSKWITNDEPGDEVFIRIFDDFNSQGTFRISLCHSPQTTSLMNGEIEKQNLLIYPNPGLSSKPIQLEMTPVLSSPAQLNILDISGRILMQRNFVNPALNPEFFTINPGVLQAGIYIVQLKTPSGLYTKKFLLID